MQVLAAHLVDVGQYRVEVVGDREVAAGQPVAVPGCEPDQLPDRLLGIGTVPARDLLPHPAKHRGLGGAQVPRLAGQRRVPARPYRCRLKRVAGQL